MYKNKQHITINKIKNNTLSVLFGLFTVFMFAQQNAENSSLSTIDTQNTAKNANKSSFVSDTQIFIAENTAFSIQLKNILLNKEVSGDGLLHIANTPNIYITSLVPITVAYVKVENTQLQLQHKLQISGRIELAKANILLNENNLITEQKVLYNDQWSHIIENSTGLWLKKQASLSNSIPKNSNLNNTYKLTVALISTEKVCRKTKNKSVQILTRNALNPYYFGQVPKPPPECV